MSRSLLVSTVHLKMFALAVVFAFSVGANAFARNLPEVTLKQGTARGFIHKTINGREFEAYFGIPYAKPPVGEYRFKVRRNNIKD